MMKLYFSLEVLHRYYVISYAYAYFIFLLLGKVKILTGTDCGGSDICSMF